MDENKSNNINNKQLSISEKFKRILNTKAEVVIAEEFYKQLGLLCLCDLPASKGVMFRRRRKKNEEDNQ